MAGRKGQERFLGRAAMRDIRLEDALDCFWRVFGLDVAIDLAAERRLSTETAADQDVIALHSVAIFALLHFSGEKTDVADEVLGAGMMAAGEMDVYRRVERNARLAP